MESQSISVKRAQVEFHNFASLGEPERAYRVYAEENERRGAYIEDEADFIGAMSPFLEIGANAGHTSYMLANRFGADGFALDISADALRHGMVLQDLWQLSRAPVRIAGDALNLPFRDGSLRFIILCQTLSQFLDLDAVFAEVCRVLEPGGVFLFCEESIKRRLSLNLYRCPYYQTMKPWERKLFDWGLLGFVAKDVIGADQEESFGIRQNYTMGLKDWQQLISRHFAEQRYRIFVRKNGWGEKFVHSLAVGLDPHRSEWLAARLLGGTISAVCRKAGAAEETGTFSFDHFEQLLRCPDCSGLLARDRFDTLNCACGYQAVNEGGVYNLIRAEERRELYPGDREDLIDFCRPGHETRLGEGWHELEGVFGNKYRWIGANASARLTNVGGGPRKLRIRGHAPEPRPEGPFLVRVQVNGQAAGQWRLDRPGMFILEADLAERPEYLVEMLCSPVWHPAGDDRPLTLSFSMLRLVNP